MKRIIICLTFSSAVNASNAQIIKKFECTKVKEDSVSATYSVRATLSPPGDRDRRLNLVKNELEKKYQITPSGIISIESWTPKVYGTFPYRIVVRKGEKMQTP